MMEFVEYLLWPPSTLGKVFMIGSLVIVFMPTEWPVRVWKRLRK